MVAGFCEGPYSLAQIKAWSRMFALFAMALLVMTSRDKFLLTEGQRAKDLLRRVVSRRRAAGELGLVSAIVSLLQREKRLITICVLT